MDAVFRGAAIYFFLLLIFRIFGTRSLAQVTTFDFVLLLIIAETTQQGLIGDDFSVTKAGLLIATLMLIELLLTRLKQRSPWFDRFSEGIPMVIVKDGQLLTERMRSCHIDVADVLASARELQGLDGLEKIKYAVLEKNGLITIIPAEGK